MPDKLTESLRLLAPIRKTISSVRARLRRFSGIQIILNAVIVTSTIVAILAVAESLIYVNASFRIGIIAVSALLILAVVALTAMLYFRKWGSLESVARDTDRAFPELKDRLYTALELAGGKAGGNYSQSLADEAIRQAAAILRDKRYSPAAISSKLRGNAAKLGVIKALTALGAVLVALIIVLTVPQNPASMAFNYLNPFTVLTQEKNFHFLVTPGDSTVMRGDSISILVRPSMYRPLPIFLHSRSVGETPAEQKIEYDPGLEAYVFRFLNLDDDIQYNISQAGESSDTFGIKVTNNPFITQLTLELDYPDYSKIENYSTGRNREIRALKGTRVTFSGKSSNPLDSAYLNLMLVKDGSGFHRAMKIENEKNISDSLTVLANGSYNISLKDTYGLGNSDTVRYGIEVIEDQYPEIAIRYPEKSSDLDQSMKLPLVFETSDDFGVRAVNIHYRRADKPESENLSGRIASYSDQPTHRADQYLWDLSSLKLLPGAEVAFRLGVIDNDMVSGPKIVYTDYYSVRFPTLDEIFNRKEDEQNLITENIEELRDQGSQLHEELDKLSEALERGKQLNWEENRQISDALERQQQMADQVNKLSEQLEQNIAQLEKNSLLSGDILKKLSDVQQLMDQVATEELKAITEKLQKALENMDTGALNQAMEQFTMTQQQFVEKLDRAASMLRKLQLEQQMDRLVEQTEMLAEMAESMQDSVAGLCDSPFKKDPGAKQNPDFNGEQNDAEKKEQAEKTEEMQKSLTEREQKKQEMIDKENPERLTTDQKTPESEKQKAAEQQPTAETQETISPEQKQAMLDELNKLFEENKAAFDEMKEAAENLDQAGESQLSEKMFAEITPEMKEQFEKLLSEIGDNLQKGRLNEARMPQKRLTDQSRQREDRVKKMQEQLRDKWKQEIAEAMKTAFDYLSFLSREQEEVAGTVERENDINHPGLIKIAEQQQDISNGLSEVLDGLNEAARDNFFISNQLLAQTQASVQLAEQSLKELSAENKNKSRVVGSSVRSLSSINAAMLTLLQDNQNLDQSQSGMGMDQMMKQLQEMAERQQNLNDQTQGMSDQSAAMPQGDPRIPMPGPSQQQGSPMPGGNLMEMLQQLAAEQKLIRDAMAEMASQMQGNKKMPGGSLEGSVKEADKVMEDILQKGITPETLERQRRILDRLLDAKRSLNQRDKSKERQSETAGEYEIQIPEKLSKELLESDNSKKELQKKLEHWQGSYPESYDILIRDYFEKLNSIEKK